jgi:hypothetical protein
MSVASVTPWESAASSGGTASADKIALGLDDDAQAPIANPPNTGPQEALMQKAAQR